MFTLCAKCAGMSSMKPDWDPGVYPECPDCDPHGLSEKKESYDRRRKPKTPGGCYGCQVKSSTWWMHDGDCFLNGGPKRPPGTCPFNFTDKAG